MPTLTDDFVKELERRILTGEWEIGHRLPPSRELAEDFHVSRSVIHAGIARLCGSGYLQTVPRQYICVANWRETGNFDLISGIIDNSLFSVLSLDELLEGRMSIETAIAARAATARTEEDLQRIRGILEAEAQCTTAQQRAQADTDFHHALAVASHNLVYTAMFNSFRPVSRKLTREFYEMDIPHKFILQTHSEIYTAIQNRNPAGAMEHMRILLVHGENQLKQQGG